MAAGKPRMPSISACLRLQIYLNRASKPFPTTPKTLGDYIKAKRFEKGLSQQQLAKQLGVTKASVCQWENDCCRPDPNHWPPLHRQLRLESGLQRPNLNR